jgi:hypothetical protein
MNHEGTGIEFENKVTTKENHTSSAAHVWWLP